MNTIFNFFLEYKESNGFIYLNDNSNTLICEDYSISILNLENDIYQKLIRKNLTKLSSLIWVGDSYLKSCGLNLLEIRKLHARLQYFFTNIDVSNFPNNFDDNIENINEDFKDNEHYIEFYQVENSNFLESTNTIIDKNKKLIDELDLSFRSKELLKGNGYLYLDDIIEFSEKDFIKKRVFPINNIREIVNFLAEFKSKNNYIDSNNSHEVNASTINNFIQKDSFESSNKIDINNKINEDIDETSKKCNVIDINIDILELDLSVRSYNALKKSGINNISDLIALDEIDLRKIKNLGTTSINEIQSKLFDYLNSRKSISIENTNKNELYLTNLKYSSIEDKFNKKLFLDPDSILLEGDFISLINKDYSTYNVLLSDVFTTLELKKLHLQQFERLYDLLSFGVYNMSSSVNSFGAKKQELLLDCLLNYIDRNVILKSDKKLIIIEAISNKIITMLKDSFFKGIERVKLIDALSSYYAIEDIVESIETLLNAKKIFVYLDDVLFYQYESFPQFLYKLDKSNIKDMMFRRINGETLDEIATKYDLTRERIRQKINKFISTKLQNLYFIEDRYKYFFETYAFTNEEFKKIFNEKDKTINYLKIRYKQGENELKESLFDENIPPRHRVLIEKFFDRDKLIINGNKILKDYRQLLSYYLANYVPDSISIDDFLVNYNEFMKNYDEEFMIPKKNRIEAFLDRIDCVMKSKGYVETDNNIAYGYKYLKVRYYDYSNYDYTRLKEVINILQYENCIIGIDYFYDKYFYLMNDYDIRDKFELHCLLRRLYGDLPNIKFTRDIHIIFDDIDQKTFILNILKEKQELKKTEFIALLDKEYGIKNTSHFWLNEIEYLLYHGTYFYNAESCLTNTQIDLLKHNLDKNFYLLDEFKEILSNYSINVDPCKISNKEYSIINYKFTGKRIIKNGFNFTEYIKKTMLSSNTITRTQIYSQFGFDSTVNAALDDLLFSYSLIEFDNHNYINVEKLNSLGITKDDFIEFTNDVLEFIGDEIYTITKLNNRGFNLVFDYLGFGDIFYESLIRRSREFNYIYLYNTLFFSKDEKLTRNSIVINKIREYRIIDTQELISIIESEYGIKLKKDHIKEMIAGTSVYYNAIMDKFYDSYDTFKEMI